MMERSARSGSGLGNVVCFLVHGEVVDEAYGESSTGFRTGEVAYETNESKNFRSPARLNSDPHRRRRYISGGIRTAHKSDATRRRTGSLHHRQNSEVEVQSVKIKSWLGMIKIDINSTEESSDIKICGEV